MTSVDDGRDFYYVQANIAVELDYEGTAALIRARHEVIAGHLVELLSTYPVQDLRHGRRQAAVREHMRRVISRLLPEGAVHNVSLTGWLLIPPGS
ncbi:MAG: flagellar basal body-associated FliL family protein [Nitrospira sp.]|nr:flagellar basal body-associated FliL family protein [Nitrospira sp.]